MFKLDDNLLIELGLGALPAQEKNRMLNHIYETLEMRVGMKLAQRMTNQQLDEFEAFIDRNDEAGALKWLETNFPNYKQVVAEELEALKAEIKAASPQILAASQQSAQMAPIQPAPQPAFGPMQQPPAPQAMPAQPMQPQPMPMPQQYPQQPVQQPMQPQPMPQQQPPAYPQNPTPPQYPPVQ